MTQRWTCGSEVGGDGLIDVLVGAAHGRRRDSRLAHLNSISQPASVASFAYARFVVFCCTRDIVGPVDSNFGRANDDAWVHVWTIESRFLRSGLAFDREKQALRNEQTTRA